MLNWVIQTLSALGVKAEGGADKDQKSAWLTGHLILLPPTVLSCVLEIGQLKATFLTLPCS